MDYDCDTLTSAKYNRAASHKFYNQLITPTRSFAIHDGPPMLHRSPSGAKRKIRQKRDGEAASRPSPFLSPSSSTSSSTTIGANCTSATPTSTISTSLTSSSASTTSSISPTPTESSNYRSLIDSGDYQSILPDIDQSFTPIPPPRLNVPFSTSMSSLELSSSSSSSSSCTSSSVYKPPPPPPPPLKPMVEVHPMPIDERSSSGGSASSIDTELFKPRSTTIGAPVKPAVPAKPKGLLVDHFNRSTSMTSLSSPVQQTTSAFLSNFVPTPSLINLQQSYRNPDLGSQDLARLETARHESIQKVNKNLSSYEDEKNFIENEMDEIERIGDHLLSVIERNDKNLASKIRRHLTNSKELVEIETNLQLQMKKIRDRVNDGVLDKATGCHEESRLCRRFQETSFLHDIYARREADINDQLSHLLHDDDMRRWKMFRDAKNRLLVDDTSVEYCIRESRMKLDALRLAPRTATTA